MKIVGLLAFRDEAPFLPYAVASLRPLVDQVVALDDRSTDAGPDLLRAEGATVVRVEAGTDFGRRREQLLEAGRAAGGTHFVAIDADEAFTAPFSGGGRWAIERLRPGEALAFPFRTLWRAADRYRIGREYDMPLACVFRDDARPAYVPAAIHEDRVPRVLRDSARVLDAGEGSMVHFQFLAWHRAQVKQAWYRCRELLDGQSPTRVNARYLTTLDGRFVRTRSLDPALLAHLPAPESLAGLPPGWHLDEIRTWFARHGPRRFEPLQIWHVEELRESFLAAEGRAPRPQTIGPQLGRLAGDLYGSGRSALRRLTRRR